MSRGSDKKPLSSVIAARLEAEIIDGTLEAGSRLDENVLAGRFEVSRTPVREALQLLTARSLVERVPYRGVIVSEISRDEIEQLFEAMGELEALCGGCAALRMSMRDRAELLALHRQMETLCEQGDRAAYDEANAAFHCRIYDGAGNQYLAEAAEALRVKLSPFRRAQLADSARMHRSSREHAAIVAAICERDPDATTRALRRHLVSAAMEILTKWALSPAGEAPANETAADGMPEQDGTAPRRQGN